MMRPDDLALEQRPNALDPVSVQYIVANILASAVVDPMVVLVALQTDERAMLIGHERRAGFDVIADNGLNVASAQVRSRAGAQFAIAFQHAKDGDLALTALLAARALPTVLVLLFAADESFVGLNHPF